MAHQVFMNARALVGGYDLSPDVSQTALLERRDEHDDTNLLSVARSFQPGLSAAAWQMEGYYDPALSDVALRDALALERVPVTIVPAGHAVQGSIVHALECLVAEAAFQSPGADLIRVSAGGQGVRPAFSGRLVSLQNQITLDSAEFVQLGQVPAGKSLYAIWHLYGITGGGQVAAIVQSDDNAGFSSAITRGTFATRSAIGSEVLVIPGPITDDYWMFNWSFPSGTPTVSFAAVFGIV